MAAISVAQLLTLYAWFPLALLLGFLLLLARFYQNFSNERTFFRLFIIPICLFGAALVRYASVNQLAGDTIGDLLFGTSGLILAMLSSWLYYLMTRHR